MIVWIFYYTTVTKVPLNHYSRVRNGFLCVYNGMHGEDLKQCCIELWLKSLCLKGEKIQSSLSTFWSTEIIQWPETEKSVAQFDLKMKQFVTTDVGMILHLCISLSRWSSEDAKSHLISNISPILAGVVIVYSASGRFSFKLLSFLDHYFINTGRKINIRKILCQSVMLFGLITSCTNFLSQTLYNIIICTHCVYSMYIIIWWGVLCDTNDYSVVILKNYTRETTTLVYETLNCRRI